MTSVKEIKNLFLRGFNYGDAETGETVEEIPQVIGGNDNLTFDTITEEDEHEIDFSRQGDLEAYARGLKIPSETIERWISAGLLLPDEIKTAQKILKILRERN